jgi:hypothetical protein
MPYRGFQKSGEWVAAGDEVDQDDAEEVRPDAIVGEM